MTPTYRIYLWGQRADVYDDSGQLYSLPLTRIEWEGKTPWALALHFKRARTGDTYSINWLVCRDELIERGMIEE